MTNMVGQLLDLTRSRLAGGIIVERQPTVLDELVSDVIEEFRVIHPLREIRAALSADLRGHWDPARLMQVVSNLIDNGIRHGDPRRPVEVRLKAVDAHAVLEVHNFGRAITADFLPVVFEPYRRRAGSRAGTKGLGLGLFISHQIVIAHGGTIDVTSDVQNGTTFAVRLPRRVGPTESNS